VHEPADQETGSSRPSSGDLPVRWDGSEATPAYRFYRLAAIPVLKTFFRLRAEGRQNIPRTGPFILAANHVSYIDPLVLGATCIRPIHFMMLREYWEKPLVGWLSGKSGSFPVDQQGHTAGALRKAMGVLAEGRILGIFPEGARSPDGSLLPGKAGVSLLMLKTGLPLLPAAILGAEKALPRGRGYPLPYRITVRYGLPISLAPPSPRDRKAFLQRSTERIMSAIEDLLTR